MTTDTASIAGTWRVWTFKPSATTPALIDVAFYVCDSATDMMPLRCADGKDRHRLQGYARAESIIQHSRPATMEEAIHSEFPNAPRLTFHNAGGVGSPVVEWFTWSRVDGVNAPTSCWRNNETDSAKINAVITAIREALAKQPAKKMTRTEAIQPPAGTVLLKTETLGEAMQTIASLRAQVASLEAQLAEREDGVRAWQQVRDLEAQLESVTAERDEWIKHAETLWLSFPEKTRNAMVAIARAYDAARKKVSDV